VHVRVEAVAAVGSHAATSGVTAIPAAETPLADGCDRAKTCLRERLQLEPNRAGNERALQLLSKKSRSPESKKSQCCNCGNRLSSKRIDKSQQDIFRNKMKRPITSEKLGENQHNHEGKSRKNSKSGKFNDLCPGLESRVDIRRHDHSL